MEVFYFTAFLIAVFLVIAYTRSATVDSASLTSKIITMESSLAPQEVFKRIERGVGPFAHEASDLDRCIVILTNKPTLATWGFFYPVHIVANGGGSTLTIGIRSRVFQVGPLVTSAHRKCQTAIEQKLARRRGTSRLHASRSDKGGRPRNEERSVQGVRAQAIADQCQ